MWYNEGTKMIMSGGACDTPDRTHLDWRYVMNTVPHFVKSGKPSLYTIYALADPRDGSIRYIGITYNVYSRMRQHSRCAGENARKNAWIQELQSLQLMFVMWSLEKTTTIEEALARELYWIRHYISKGADLTNVAGMPEPGYFDEERLEMPF